MRQLNPPPQARARQAAKAQLEGENRSQEAEEAYEGREFLMPLVRHPDTLLRSNPTPAG